MSRERDHVLWPMRWSFNTGSTVYSESCCRVQAEGRAPPNTLLVKGALSDGWISSRYKVQASIAAANQFCTLKTFPQPPEQYLTLKV